MFILYQKERILFAYIFIYIQMTLEKCCFRAQHLFRTSTCLKEFHANKEVCDPQFSNPHMHTFKTKKNHLITKEVCVNPHKC